jgi:hypothetical protein
MTKMSALDELRKKADEKKAAENQAELNKEQQEATYRNQLLPKMQLFYDTFNESINCLNFLEEPVTVHNYCERYPQFGSLAQKNYKIVTDGRVGLASYNRIMQINLSFVCEGKGSFNYPLISTYLIDKEVAFLQEKKLTFDWKYLTPIDGKANASFTVKRRVPVSFQIEVDYKHSLIKVTIHNHDNLKWHCKSFTPEQLDDDFLDSLLSYFLRKDMRFLVKMGEISPEVKADIKSALHNYFANHEEHAHFLKEIAPEQPPAAPETESAKRANFIQNIFSRLHK